MNITISREAVKTFLRVVFVCWALLGGAAGFHLWLQPTGLTYWGTTKKVSRSAALDILISNEVKHQLDVRGTANVK